MIKHIRIDERLIHGQVATMWCNYLAVDRIMVVNDKANGSEFEKKMLRMATPTTIQLSVLTIEKAIDRIQNGQYDNEVVLMIIKSTKDALAMHENGYEFSSLNIGNISKKDDNPIQIFNGVYLNEVDQKVIKRLKEKNVEISSRMVPNDSSKKL